MASIEGRRSGPPDRHRTPNHDGLPLPLSASVGSTEASEEHLYLNGIGRTQHFPHYMPAIGPHVWPVAATYL